MKKALILVLIPIVILIFITSCKVSTSKNIPQLTGTVDISFLYAPTYTEAGEPPLDWEVYKTIKNEIDVNLHLQALPNDMTDQDNLIEKLARDNNLPDIFRVNHDVLVDLVKADKVIKIDDVLELMPERTRASYATNSKKPGAIDGVQYGLSSIGALPRNEGVCIRKDWLDKLGLQVPKTLEEYKNVMRAFTYNDPDGNGKNDTYGFGAFIENTMAEDGLGKRFDFFFGAYGVAGTLNPDPYEPHLNIKDQKFYDALNYIRSLIDEGLVDPNWNTYTKNDFRNAWKAGKFGIMREQFAALSLKANYSEFDKNFPKGEWIVIDPPIGPYGDSAVGVDIPNYRTIAISKNAYESGKLPRIAKLLEWMRNDGYMVLSFGKEGVNFLYDKEGNISDKVPVEYLAYTHKNMQPYLQLKNVVFSYSDFELRPNYPKYNSLNGKEIDPLKYLRQMQSKSWVNGQAVAVANKLVRSSYENVMIDFVTRKSEYNRASWLSWVNTWGTNGGNTWESQCISNKL